MKGIEPEAREAAKDAARRAGLTLGQWLNQRILDPESHEPGRGGGESADAVASRLDALSRRLDRISGLDRAKAAPPPETAAEARPEIASIVARLDRTDRHLDGLLESVADLSQKLETARTAEDARSAAALEKALTNVVDHIELTDRRNGEVLKAIQSRLSELASRMPAGTDAVDGTSRAAILALEDRVNDLAGRLETADRALGFDPSLLERRLAELARKVDVAQETARRNPGLEQFEARLSQLAAKLGATERAMAPQTDVNSLRSEVGKLRDDVSRVREPSKPAIVQALESRLNSVSNEVASLRSSAAPSSALNSLNNRLEQIVARLAETEPAVRAASRVGPLEQRLAELAERLDRAVGEGAERQPHPRIVELEARVEELAARFGEAPDQVDPSPAIEELEAQVRAIASRLDGAEQHFGALQSIESSLGQLFESLEASRKAAIDAAEQAAYNAASRIMESRVPDGGVAPGEALTALERGLAEVKAQTATADTRNQETLEAIHDTLKRVIDRLGVLEEKSASGPAPMRPVIGRTGADDLDDFRLPPMPDLSAPPATAKEATVAAPEEPRAAASESTVAAKEAESDEEPTPFASAYDTPTPPAPRNEDFIAAARRAAQAASDGSNDLASLRTRGDAEEEGRGGFFRGRRRSLLFAAAALFIIAGALSVSGLIGHGEPREEDPAMSSMTAPIGAPEARPTTDAAEAETDSDPAPPSQSAANLFADVGEADTRTPVESRAAVAVENKDAAPPAPARKLAAPKPQPAMPNESVLAPRGAAPAKIATTPTAPAEEPEVEAGKAAGPEPDEEMMTALAIDPVETDDEPPPLPAGDSALARAAADGDARAQFEIGARFADGRAGETSAAKAAQWYQRAAAQGLAPAQYRLGALYEKGHGVPADKGAAKIWYQRAAEQGNVKAMHNLAVLLAGGVTGSPDYARAARWFVKAASYGLTDSQFNLAVLHERGLGVEHDPAAAYKWFMIAADSGDQEAEARMSALADQLEPASLARARAEAQAWRPASPDPAANVVELPPGLQAAAAAVTIGPGGDGTIARAQALLATLGYDPGPADGLAGPRTRDAVIAFKRERGLAETGAITPDLVELLELAADS